VLVEFFHSRLRLSPAARRDVSLYQSIRTIKDIIVRMIRGG
jgi:hypothetical protein